MLSKFNYVISNLLLKSNYRILRHLLVQLAVVLISINALWDASLHLIPNSFADWLAYFCVINVLIYVNAYLLVPRLLLQGRVKLYLLLTPLLILLIILGVGMIQSGSDNHYIGTPPLIGLSAGFCAFTLFIIGLTTLQLWKYRMANAQRINDLKNATMEVELASLQNQINPHFLFNVLNNANILVDEDADKSSFMLSKLNELLHYQVEREARELVPLNEDLKFLEDYLELEKMRRDRFTYNIRVDGDSDIEVPPLLFIPFVENAVKHNPGNDSYVDIVLRIAAGKLYFKCENPKAQTGYSRKEGGIGLRNIKRRLDLLFEDAYKLDLIDKEEKYTVIMELKI
ncbi:MAG TPA: histidine kinase [Bacteroides reticulotermitis]|nr:histidine kinase [Bacteroides reticulotermitis]